jgi:phosphoribosyl 1,2-cyclic phosphodiesterase
MQATRSSDLWLKFWGVRGSTATPQLENLIYGGNTPCVEIRLPDNRAVIFDCGTGARNLGQSLMREFQDQKLALSVFLTHFHWDHIQGIPFFAPLYDAGNELTFYTSCELGSIEQKLRGQMTEPYFPVSLEYVGAQCNFVELNSEPVLFGEVTIYPFPLNHPQGAVGYRIDSPDTVIVYATDLEHGNKRLDGVLRDYSQDADMLIYDAQFTPDEYDRHKGWGHSTWLEATRLAREVRAEQLVLFHHNPWHTDKDLFEIVCQARRQFENTVLAAENWSTDIQCIEPSPSELRSAGEDGTERYRCHDGKATGA